MPGTTLIDPTAATGLVEFSQLKICGFQFGTVSCTTGLPILDGPENVLTGCSLDNFNWEADTEDDIDISGKCASHFEKGAVKWIDYEFGFCEKKSTLLDQMLGQHDLMTGTENGTDVVGMMGPEIGVANDNCCPTEGGCDDTDVYMLVWGWAKCGPDFHPDYRFVVKYIPRLDFEYSGSGEWQDDNFSEYTYEARALKPRAAVGAGPGGIIPAHYQTSMRPYYIIGTNSPPPTCGGCGQCGGI